MKTTCLLILAILLSMSAAARAGWVTLPGSGSVTVKVASLKERQFRATVRQKHDYSCGSAALATLLTYHYRDPVTEEQTFQEMWENGDQEKIRREGFSLLDIKHYLEARGYSADGYEASLDRLAKIGIPAITLIRDNGYNHFVVIKGVRDGKVAIGDPSAGARIVSRAAFEKMRSNKIMFVINDGKDRVVFDSRLDWHIKEKAPLGLSGIGGDLVNSTLLRRAQTDL